LGFVVIAGADKGIDFRHQASGLLPPQFEDDWLRIDQNVIQTGVAPFSILRQRAVNQALQGFRAIGEDLAQIGRRQQRQPRLADTPDAGEGDQAVNRQQLLNLRDLVFAADKAGQRQRQVMGRRFWQRSRREIDRPIPFLVAGGPWGGGRPVARLGPKLLEERRRLRIRLGVDLPVQPQPQLLGFDYWVYPEFTMRYSDRRFYHNSFSLDSTTGWSWDHETQEARSYLTTRGARPFFLYFNIEPQHMPLADCPENYRRMYSREQVTIR